MSRELVNLRDGRVRLVVSPAGGLVLALPGAAVFLDPEDAAGLAAALAGWFGGRLVRDEVPEEEDPQESIPAAELASCARPGCGHLRHDHCGFGCTAPHGQYRCLCPVFLP